MTHNQSGQSPQIAPTHPALGGHPQPGVELSDAELAEALSDDDVLDDAIPGELFDDQGAITAEYAVVIMAAVAFAGVLVAIMRSEEVRAFLLNLVERALGTAG